MLFNFTSTGQLVPKYFSSDMDTMESTWTVRSYLETNRLNGVKWSEKNLRDDINAFVGNGEVVKRAVAQQLRVILIKSRKVSQILVSPMHEKFLDEKRTSNSLLKNSPVTFIQNQKVSSISQCPVQASSVQSKPILSKSSKPLGKSGKRYRFKRLKAEMNPSDFNLIAEKGRKGKMDTFQVLNYQHDAHLSSRGMDKTNQLVKQQTGFQVLPGRHLLDEAKKTTYPEKILSDDYNVEVSLQRALDKTVERLLHSDEINNEVKEIIKEKKEITFSLKSGQDGTSGFSKNNKRISRGTSKQQVALVPLALKLMVQKLCGKI